MDRINEIFNSSLQTGYVDKKILSELAYQPELLVNQKNPPKKVLSSILFELENCNKFYISVAFVTTSGVATIINKLKELEENKTAFNDLKARNDADIKQKMARMMDKLVVDIKRVVESKAKAGGYTYVLDSSSRGSNQTEFILYNNGENDLTQIVLDQLNAAAPIDAGKK